MFERIKSWFRAKPPIAIQHSDFGTLTLEAGLWSGEIQRDGRTIRFFIGGTDNGPDAELIRRLRDILGKFGEIERAGLEFIRAHEPGLGDGEFTFYAVDLLWEDRPEDFALEFEAAGDIDGVWRVEFEDGRPKSVGRDD